MYSLLGHLQPIASMKRHIGEAGFLYPGGYSSSKPHPRVEGWQRGTVVPPQTARVCVNGYRSWLAPLFLIEERKKRDVRERLENL